jgi:hypothetical protein
MEPDDSLPCSQKPSTCSYPQPDQSSSHHPIPSLVRSILILSTHLRLYLPKSLYPSGFFTISCIHSFYPIRATCPARLILLDLIMLIILGEEKKLYHEKSMSIFHPTVYYFAQRFAVVKLVWQSDASSSQMRGDCTPCTSDICFLLYRVLLYLIDVLTPWISGPLEKLIVAQLLENLPALIYIIEHFLPGSRIPQQAFIPSQMNLVQRLQHLSFKINFDTFSSIPDSS